MTEAMFVIIAITLLVVKHFIVDFPMQKPYQWKNKGTYGHPGGILHAGLHGIGTLLVFLLLIDYSLIAFIIGVALLDMVVHYHIDWAKMNINKKYGWGANTHEEFWILLGVDQLLHMLTYIVIVLIVIL